MLRTLINQRLGRYLIKELLGRGGMAAVYRATDTVLQRDIALKILYPQYSDEQNHVERFMREAVTAAALEHPAIVPIYDVGEQDGMVYIAMKLLAGRSFQDLLQERGALPPDELLAILEPVAAALDYAHEHGVIHRDIKPGNILIERGADHQLVVMLTDFGIAKLVDRPGLTTTGALIGTPDYMAPEQISGSRLDRRADVYALGMLAFRALTGVRAFAGSTQDVLMAHLHSAPPRPSTRNPQLSPAIDAVILRAIERDPAARQATAGAFVRELRAAGAGLPPAEPAPPPRPPMSASPAGPLPATLTPAGSATAGQPPVGAPTLSEQRAASTRVAYQAAAPRPLPPERTPNNWLPWLVVLVLGLSTIGLAVFVILTLSRCGSGSNNAAGGATAPPPLVFSPGPTDVVPAGPSPSPSPSSSPSPTATVEAPTAEPPTIAPPTAAPPTAAPPTARPATPVPPPPPPSVTPSNTATITSTPEPSATPTETATPSPSPTPCPDEFLEGGFGRLFREEVGIRVRLGCPTGRERAGIAAQQFFARGMMFYWQSSDTIYVLQGREAGTYLVVSAAEAAALPTPPPMNDPNAPVRGFGRVYFGMPGVAEALGEWLTAEELLDGNGVIQFYERGMMIYTPSYYNGTARRAIIFVLYNDSSFERYNDR